MQPIWYLSRIFTYWKYYLDKIDKIHRRAEISYVIEPKITGKGVATQAIAQVIMLAKSEYNLIKLSAGVADKNEGVKV